MEPHQKPLFLNAAGLLLWTLLTAALNTASIMIKKDLFDTDWPSHGTFGWLAFMYAILTFGLLFSNKSMAQSATNAYLCGIFSALLIAQLSPSYVGIWKDIANPTDYQKMDICVIVFSAFSIGGAYSMNAHLVTFLHKKWCEGDKTAPAQEAL